MTETTDPTAEDLTCPVCDYALRGLPEPRCPECGYAFEWAELREQAKLRHSWFYEHAGTFRSHFKTRWRSLRPRSFWAQVHAYTEATPQRLWRYRLTSLALLVLVGLFVAGIPFVAEWLDRTLPQGHYVVVPTKPTSGSYLSVPANSGFGGPASTTQPMTYAIFVPPPGWAGWARLLLQRSYVSKDLGPAVADALMTLALLIMLPLYWQVLRVSVLRANIRPVHLARVDAYSTDVLPFALIGYVVAEYLWGLAIGHRHYYVDFGTAILHLLIGPAVVLGLLLPRLWSALHRYVRFPRAAAVTLGFGLIAALAWLTVSLQLAMLLRF